MPKLVHKYKFNFMTNITTNTLNEVLTSGMKGTTRAEKQLDDILVNGSVTN